MKLLDHELTQQMVDYSFGDHSGVLGGVPNAYMKKASWDNDEFVNKVYSIRNNRPITLFIDNIRLYQRPIEFSDWQHQRPIKKEDRKWLEQFDDEDLLKACSHFQEHTFHIFTAFEDTPLDDYIWDKIPKNVISINAANGVVFGGRVKPFPHGIERIMYPGYDHHEILKEEIAKGAFGMFEIEPKKLLFVAHRTDTGNRSHLAEMFSWATVTHLPYEQYLEEMKNHKFVLCPSGNGIGSSRNWETLYMRRVPVMEDHPYTRELFRNLPVLFVKDYSEVTEQLLKDNEYLFEQAQNMDMKLLDLDYWFNNAIK